MRRNANRRTTVVVNCLAVVLVCVLGVSCSQTSPTREIARDPSESTIPGVAPTAPTTTAYDGRGLSSDAMSLIGELNGLLNENDVCKILTGDALKPFLSGDFDATNLVTSPSGLSQLLVAVDSLFAHLVDIAPAEIKPAMATIRTVWKRAASIDPGSVDRDSAVQAIMAEPGTRAAAEILGNWLPRNCGSSSNVLSGIPGLAP